MFHIHPAKSVALLVLLVCAAMPGGAACSGREGDGWFQSSSAKRALPRPLRSAWVARFHYRTPQEIANLMDSCRALGFNTVLWQVRGQGTVAYPSRFEPWSEVYQHQDPGFDPLAIAVAEAHSRGLRIEAWINVMPGWKGPRPPPSPTQLWNAHPDWFLIDAQGERQPLGEFYVIVNPALPDVRRHIVNVAEEIVAKYKVDGLHLDYVRYAWDTDPAARKRYMRDPRTLEIYRRETGLTPDADERKWDDWRANQITRLVREIRLMMDRRRPQATLSAAVWRNPRMGLSSYLQNAAAWLRAGLLDVAYPMAYTKSLQQFESDITLYHQAAPGKRVAPGIGAYLLQEPQLLAEQLRACQAWGGDFAIYSVESLAPVTGEAVRTPAPEVVQGRLMRRRVLTDFIVPRR